jgi:CspA family cold shock protein
VASGQFAASTVTRLVTRLAARHAQRRTALATQDRSACPARVRSAKTSSAASTIFTNRSPSDLAFKELTMAEGTIKRLTDKGFGFISNESGSDLFFHMSSVEGVRFEDLREGQKVSFNEGRGPKGPRAENVRPI